MPEQIGVQVEDAKILLKELQQFDEALKKDWGRVLNKWQNLKPTWRDKQYKKFAPMFEKLSLTYKKAIKDCEQYMDYLKHQIREGELLDSELEQF